MTQGFSAVEAVRSIYDAYESGDLHTPAERFRADAESYISEHVPWGGYRKGRTELQECYALLRQHVASTFEPDEIIDCGSRVVAVGRTTGFVQETSRIFSVRTVHIWHFKDGKIVRFENHLDREFGTFFEKLARAS